MTDCLICYDETSDVLPCGHNCHYDCLASLIINSSNKNITNKCCFCFKDLGIETLTNIVKNCSKIKELIQTCVKKDNPVLLSVIQEHHPEEYRIILIYSIKNVKEFSDFIKKNNITDENIIIYALMLSDKLEEWINAKIHTFVRMLNMVLTIITEQHLNILINYMEEKNYDDRNKKYYISHIFKELNNKCLSDEILYKMVAINFPNCNTNKYLVKYNNFNDELIRIVIKNNNLYLFEKIVNVGGYKITKEMIDYVIINRCKEIMHFLLNQKLWNFTDAQIIMAIEYGIVDYLLTRLLNQSFISLSKSKIILLAATKAQYNEKNDIYIKLFARYIPDINTMIQIYKDGQIDKFKFYLEKINQSEAELVKNELGIH